MNTPVIISDRADPILFIAGWHSGAEVVLCKQGGKLCLLESFHLHLRIPIFPRTAWEYQRKSPLGITENFFLYFKRYKGILHVKINRSEKTKEENQ